MESEQPLTGSSIVHGAVDYHGRLASRRGTGGWRAAKFIISVIVLERFADFGLSTNLIMYLTGVIGESNAAAAANVNAWSGVGYTLSLLAAHVADSWIGQFPTIVCASLIYTLESKPSILRFIKVSQQNCHVSILRAWACMLRPPLLAFGAAQFDENDPEECASKSSFFNWWSVGICSGIVLTTLVTPYIQENISWGLGFGILCLAMALSPLIFTIGGRTYRYHTKSSHNNPLDEQESLVDKHQLLSSNKNMVNGEKHQETSSNTQEQCGKHKGGEVAAILELFPIWATSLMYAITLAQSRTFFIKQGSFMDRKIGPTFQVPSATLRSSVSITVVSFLPIYDRVFVRIARKFTGLTTGITMLQRIGIGMLSSTISMVLAAMVEMKRLEIANDLDLVKIPGAVVPMSVWWLLPQYILVGITDVFALAGLQEFFYSQVPSKRRSLGAAICSSIYGVANFISGSLVSLVDKATRRSGESWFADNLNQGHLDYFYWLLAGLNVILLFMYMYFSRAYVYRKEN